jgi:flavorubredoxin
MPKWIDKTGNLRISKNCTLTYGDDIPKEVPKERIKQLMATGQIGDILAPVTDHKDNVIEALKAENAFLIGVCKYVESIVDQIKSTKPKQEIQAIIDSMGGGSDE